MVFCAILLMVVVIGVSYAFATLHLEGTKKQVIRAGTLELILDEDENNLTIENVMPMYDEVGMIQEAFTFRLINNSTVATNYKIKLVDITAEGVEKLDTSLVRYGLIKNKEEHIGTLSDLTDGVIDSGQTPSETIEYELKLWIDSRVTDETLIKNKSLSYRIDIEIEQDPNDSYIFVFHPNGGEGEKTTIVCVYGQECDLTNIPFTQNNRTLIGWATTSDGERAYTTDLRLEDVKIEIGEKLDLYAVWGLTYLYNEGNQFADDTVGWTYTRTWHGGTSIEIASETASFTDSYIEWKEVRGVESGYWYYGAGYFQHQNLMDLTGAKTINFEYTTPTFSTGTSAATVTFYVLDSAGTAIKYQSLGITAPSSTKQTYSLDVSEYDLSSVRIRVSCSTMQTGQIMLLFRLYNVYAVY